MCQRGHNMSYKKSVAKIIERLPEEQKIVLSLSYVEKLSFEEIAEILGKSPTEVSRIFIRAASTCIADSSFPKMRLIIDANTK